MALTLYRMATGLAEPIAPWLLRRRLTRAPPLPPR